MNMKGFGRKRSSPNRIIIPEFSFRDPETRKYHSQDRQFSDQDSNRAPAEYKSILLPLDQPVLFCYFVQIYRVISCSQWRAPAPTYAMWNRN
jgi:hypothetical protein